MNAHKASITALAFSQEGKYLAAYAAQDAKISFWQTQQTFLVNFKKKILKSKNFFKKFDNTLLILGYGTKSNSLCKNASCTF